MEPSGKGSLSHKTNTAAKVSLSAGLVSFFALFPAVYYGNSFAIEPVQISPAGRLYLLCLVPALEFCGIAAVTAGILALRQIKRTGQRGTWAAVIGLVFGLIGLAIVVFVYRSRFMAGWL